MNIKNIRCYIQFYGLVLDVRRRRYEHALTTLKFDYAQSDTFKLTNYTKFMCYNKDIHIHPGMNMNVKDIPDLVEELTIHYPDCKYTVSMFGDNERFFEMKDVESMKSNLYNVYYKTFHK